MDNFDSSLVEIDLLERLPYSGGKSLRVTMDESGDRQLGIISTAPSCIRVFTGLIQSSFTVFLPRFSSRITIIWN